MNVKLKMIVWITASVILLLFVGCRLENPTRTDLQLNNAPAASTPSSDPQSPTAVESAIALSDKYAKLSQEASEMRQNNQKLDAENKQLKEDLQSCRLQSEQTQKELAQANDLLLQTRLELNNWKNDVLGFRGEMRDAQKAQLDALLKILKLMGGEVNQTGIAQIQDSKEQK